MLVCLHALRKPLVALLVVVSAASCLTGGGSPSVPDDVWSLRMPDLRDPDRTIALADFDGQPLVVNVFASWCAPCRREMPVLEAVAQQVAGSVAFLGITHQDDPAAALRLLDETGVSYPAAHGNTDVSRAFDVVGMPTTVFLSERGEVRQRWSGEIEAAKLEELLERFYFE